MEIRPGSSANSVVSSAHMSMRSVFGRIFGFCLFLKRLSATLVVSSGASRGRSLGGPLSGGSSSAFEFLPHAPESIILKFLDELCRPVGLTFLDVLSLKRLSVILVVSSGASRGRSLGGPLPGGSSSVFEDLLQASE